MIRVHNLYECACSWGYHLLNVAIMYATAKYIIMIVMVKSVAWFIFNELSFRARNCHTATNKQGKDLHCTIEIIPKITSELLQLLVPPHNGPN